MRYQETTGATSRDINPDFMTDKTVNEGRSQTWLEWVQELTELYKPMRGRAREGGAGRNKEGVTRKRY